MFAIVNGFLVYTFVLLVCDATLQIESLLLFTAPTGALLLLKRYYVLVFSV